MTKDKINAHFPNTLDYPNLILRESESHAAEARLAGERKLKKKLSAKKFPLTRNP
jgi:hypothetical protein